MAVVGEEERTLEAILSRRKEGVVCDSAELCRRIAELGDMKLATKARHQAFEEVFDSLTPPGFRLMPVPNSTTIESAESKLNIAAVLIDIDVHEQVVAEIVCQFELKQRCVRNELLRVQDAYRGAKLSYVLFDQALSLYQQIGLHRVLLHAALETGRWHWARVGFEFDIDSRPAIAEWAQLCMLALGRAPLPPDFRASELALLGSEPDGAHVSFEFLTAALEQAVKSTDAETRAAVAAVEQRTQLRARSGGPTRWLSAARFRRIAALHHFAYDEQLPLGKAIMLMGPDWYGVFDLTNSAALEIFELEFARGFTDIDSTFGSTPS